MLINLGGKHHAILTPASHSCWSVDHRTRQSWTRLYRNYALFYCLLTARWGVGCSWNYNWRCHLGDNQHGRIGCAVSPIELVSFDPENDRSVIPYLPRY